MLILGVIVGKGDNDAFVARVASEKVYELFKVLLLTVTVVLMFSVLV